MYYRIMILCTFIIWMLLHTAGQGDTHTQPCLRPHRWQIAGQGDTHTALPTRPHRWQIAGQGDTHTHSTAYKTAQMAARRSEHTHIHTQP